MDCDLYQYHNFYQFAILIFIYVVFLKTIDIVYALSHFYPYFVLSCFRLVTLRWHRSISTKVLQRVTTVILLYAVGIS